MNKTIYVKDEDGPIWDRARELAGDGMSQLIMDRVRFFVAEREGKQRGFERIVLRYAEDGIPQAKAFWGRWLISPEEAWSELFAARYEERDKYAVAVTAKDNVVVFNYDSVLESGEFNKGQLFIYDSLPDVLEHHSEELVELSMRRRGIEVQELDI